MNKKTIHIAGMTCTSCEIIITDELNQIEEINRVVVCSKKKTAEIRYQGNLDVLGVIKKIKELGYDASEELIKNSFKANKQQWFYAFLALVGIYIVFKYLKWIGVMRLLEIDTSEVSFGVAFVVGIVASMSTCLVIVGAVVMSFASKYKTQGSFYKASVKPHLIFHLGRLATFFVLGGVLGMIGGWFSISLRITAIMTVVLAIILVWLGLNIVGLFPSMSSFGIRMPRGIMKTWNRLKESEHRLAPVLLGGITFFLPCGFTQSMQLFALSSGSFWTGAFTMFLFALGTLPILLTLGIASSRAKNRKRVVFQLVIGILIVVFAFYTMQSGLAMLGLNSDFLPSSKNETELQFSDDGGEQVVKMNIGYYGFEPQVINLKKGVPVKWIIDGDGATGCTNKIIVPSLNISKKINSGDNIVEFTPEESGTIPFSCWMGMVRGKFIVE
ncbi:MAG: sulfite exporter TauE/SafE family protein [Candidatus Magasanikbacteria bacterium]